MGTPDVQVAARVQQLEARVQELLAEGTQLFERHSQKEQLLAQVLFGSLSLAKMHLL